MAYTSFFRDSDALEAIEKVVMPALSHLRAIQIWDAGCASGEEPYTLAILFASRLGPFSFRGLDILATDHEESSFPQFADQIKKAMYGRKDIMWVPQELRDRYFLPTDDPEYFLLDAEIREKVRYCQHDLLSLVPPEMGKSLIVCKNVIMHFTPTEQVGVLEMYWKTLSPGGFLVLDGNQDMARELKDRFERVEEGWPLYRKYGS